MHFLRRERPLNRKIALLAKMTSGALLPLARKARQPSDDALMRGGLRLRKFVLLGSRICLSLNLARMRLPRAAMVGVGLR